MIILKGISHWFCKQSKRKLVIWPKVIQFTNGHRLISSHLQHISSIAIPLYRTFFTSRLDRSEHCTIDGTTGYCATMMSSTLLQTVQWWQNASIIYNANADSAVKFVETILGFCFKVDSLHTHTILMQYSFRMQCYRGNDLL
jgi:hypothetical protein